MIRNLFNCNANSESILYINDRLVSRKTYIDWNGKLMGPINDERGLEQGGVSSSDFYKIFAKEQLTSAQESGLGVPLGDITISAIGQADDSALISNNIHKLMYLLVLTEIFCNKHHAQ